MKRQCLTNQPPDPGPLMEIQAPGSIATLPQEVFDMVTANLETDNILSLRLSCRRLNFRARPIHLDKIFNVRKYHWTIADLTALGKLTENIYDWSLKHLIIDVGPPYIDPASAENVREGQTQSLALIPNTIQSKFRMMLKWGFQFYMNELFLNRHPDLFACAIPLLPDITHLEITGPGDHATIPDKVVLSHYRPFIPMVFKDFDNASKEVRDNYERLFLDFYRSCDASPATPEGIPTRRYLAHNQSRYTIRNFPRSVFSYVLCTMKICSRELEVLRFLKKDKTVGYIELYWFYKNSIFRQDYYHPTLTNLKELVLHIGFPSPSPNSPAIDHSRPRVITFINNCQTALASMINSLEKLENLCITCNKIRWYQTVENFLVNQVQMNAVIMTPKAPDGSHRPYIPLLRLSLLDRPDSVLRKINFDTLAFSQAALLKFLLDRKETLREVFLINCQLQAPKQLWSEVFQALESLSLEYFEYESTHIQIFSWVSDALDKYSLMSISWFRVYKNITDESHYCELLPDKRGITPIETTIERRRRISYNKAMEAIEGMEKIIVSEERPETRFERHIKDSQRATRVPALADIRQ